MQKEQQQDIQEYPITKIPIADLVFDPTNPNVLSAEQMNGLRLSMQKFGYLTPIIVDQQTKKIADGEHRALVYKEMGLQEIPAILMSLETDSDRKQLRQVMNKLHGFHDKQMDANELVQIFQAQKLDELSQLIAQPKEDLQRLMLRYHPSLEFVTPENEQEIDKLIDEELKRIAPDTALGEIYQLGQHRIICADCTDKDSVEKLMDGAQATSIITDPPYQMGKDIENDDLDDDDYGQLHLDFMSNLPAEDQATMICFHGTRVFPIAIDASRKTGWQFKRMLWLRKPNDITFPWRGWVLNSEAILVFTKGNGYWNDIKPYHHDTYDFNHHGGELAPGEGWHPAVKPLEVIADLLSRVSKQDDIVFDPFVGAGTTIIACERTGRICYSMDIDPRYVDITIKRWEKYTGKKAVKLDD